MPRVALHNVTKLYGSKTALANVSLSFEDDVTTTVVGRSGSGKSTLIQMINALVRPDEGSVEVFDRSIDYGKLPELRRQIGYAVQGTGLFPHMTVENNIGLLAGVEGWSRERARRRIEELMALVELPVTFAKRYPHELSGGEQQRVGLCRAMMLDPPVFLLDEPFGALDPITRGEIHKEFLRLQGVAARTIILVTHDVREAKKLSQRIVVLEAGAVVQHGSTEEVIRRPANESVADLFSTQLDEPTR